MNNAEMRSRLTRLGLSLRQLSTITGWDYRELRRAANGMVRVSPRTVAMVTRLEQIAEGDRETMQATVAAGAPIVIPHFSDEGRSPYFEDEGVMPSSYWHALAGTVLVTNAEAAVVYEAGDDDE